jgi:thiamine-phosphate pyrophosphorylase
LLARLEDVLSVGPSVGVQHRHPGAPDRQFYEEGKLLAERCRASRNPLFVNGRLDIALLLGSHLHLPARGIRVEDVRPHLPPSAWVSIAVHDAAEAEAAEGADLALVSPVFPPGSKPTDLRPPLGVDGFWRLATTLPCPPFALGGIDPANASSIRGEFGFAAISSVLRAEDPKNAASELVRAAGRTRP